MNLNFDNRIFFERGFMLAAASLGQIVEGYSVVFGEDCKINLKECSDRERRQFLDFLEAVREIVERRFGNAVLFEHGAVSSGTNLSCGVDRMHVHVVPYSGPSLNRTLAEKYERLATAPSIEQGLDILKRNAEARPYFWIEEGNEVHLFWYGEKRESQVVRRELARIVGIPNRWNWREYPTQDTAERVARELRTETESVICDGRNLITAVV